MNPASVADLKQELAAKADPEKAAGRALFFKTGPGDYGHGDQFLGLTVPEQRSVARKYRHLGLDSIAELLCSAIHEERFIALVILVSQYDAGDPRTRTAIFDFYLRHTAGINNWDLVDASAPYIVGQHLLHRSRKLLTKLARSEQLWERRIAIVATLGLIRHNETADAFAISKLLLRDKHDLIHKACGWALREAGKKDPAGLLRFLQENYSELPRTTLRYAIERFPEAQRKELLAKHTSRP